MCGRFAQVVKHNQLKKLIDELDIKNRSEQLEMNYNVAPTQAVGAVISKNDERLLTFFRWGLIPSWSKEPESKFSMINVRAETILEKPTFRSALQRRRCLIPATGFFEWRKTDKQPFFIAAPDGEPLLLAGICEYWQGADGSYIPSTAILTTSPNELMQSLHDRMPVIITQDALPTWLNDRFQDAASLQALLLPCPSGLLNAYPVSKLVNNINNNSEDCLKPLTANTISR